MISTAMRCISTAVPQKTRVDFIENGKKKQADGLVTTRLVTHGAWKIDRSNGKTLCLVEVAIPKLGIVVNFTPSEAFEDELLKAWLDAEKANDNFVFPQPVLAFQRPSQLQKKTQHIHKVIEEYVRTNG